MNKEHSFKDPAISVCMPMYNASLHLWDCIDSILGQSFGSFELLIADDGSTDSSVRIVQSYADPRIRLFQLEHDYIHTCNYLLHQARGKYIARMDADDVMCPDRLQIEFDYMEEHPEVDIVGGRLNYIGQPPTAGDGKPVEVTAMMLRRGSVLAHPTVMLRRERLMACRLEYQREYIYAEDYNLWADAVIAGLRIVDLPEVLVNYRFSENQVTYKYNKEQAANARKVQLKLLRHLDAARNKEDERCPEVAEPLPGNRLTLIIPFLNEGSEVRNTLHSIRECAADRVEVIVINDASDDGIDYASEVRPFRVSYLVNKHRKGVAGCRDWGISLCRTPFFLLLDAHMRFYDGRWPERLVSLLEADDRVLLCCQTRFLEKDGEGVVRLCEECATTYGAVTPFEQNQYWPDIKWNYRERCPGQDVEPVANVLGAGYAASVRYWQYLKGLQGLSKYGNDESLISFKVWREGGRCLLVKDVVIGHIYRSSSPYKHYREEEVANYLLVSYLIFPQAWYCRSLAIALRKDPALYGSAALHLQQEEEAIESQKEYLSSIFTVPFASVLQLHRERMADTPDLQKMKATLAAVNNFVKAHPVTRGGLYEGKAGQLLWFCHYAHRLEDDSLYGLQRELWKSLEKDILYRALPWNFAHGVSGVGWVLMYLHAWGLSDAYPELLLEQIDKQLQEVDADRLPAGMDEGVGGILAYAVLRLKTGTPQWDNKFAEALRQAAMRVPSETTELPAIYYAVFYTELLKRGTKVDAYLPHINEWLKPGQHLPSNPKYWSPVLMDGCMGAVINLLTSINNHKKTICDEA